MKPFVRQTFLLVGVVLAVACAQDKPKDGQQGTPKPALACASRPKMLNASESVQISFSRQNTTAEIIKTLDIGNVESVLNWGALSAAADTSITYTAPSYVPATATLNASATTSDGASIKCPIYLLASQAPAPVFYGVKEDGAVIGLPVSVYNLASPPAAFPDVSALTPSIQSVVRNLDFNLDIGTTPLNGVATATANLALVFKGALLVPDAQTYEFRLTANPHAEVIVKDSLTTLYSSGGAPGTVDVTFPSAGSYSFQVNTYYASGTFQLQLEWAVKNGVTVGPFTPVPYGTFDRQ